LHWSGGTIIIIIIIIICFAGSGFVFSRDILTVHQHLRAMNLEYHAVSRHNVALFESNNIASDQTGCVVSHPLGVSQYFGIVWFDHAKGFHGGDGFNARQETADPAGTIDGWIHDIETSILFAAFAGLIRRETRLLVRLESSEKIFLTSGECHDGNGKQ
jgi:hypothetical protein